MLMGVCLFLPEINFQIMAYHEVLYQFQSSNSFFFFFFFKNSRLTLHDFHPLHCLEGTIARAVCISWFKRFCFIHERRLPFVSWYHEEYYTQTVETLDKCSLVNAITAKVGRIFVFSVDKVAWKPTHVEINGVIIDAIELNNSKIINVLSLGCQISTIITSLQGIVSMRFVFPYVMARTFTRWMKAMETILHMSFSVEFV